MKILLAHNYYGSSAPSGENKVFLAERDLLKSRGHEVIEYTRHSDEIRNHGFGGTMRGAFSTPWNPFSQQKVLRILKDEEPDIMHAHNTFPLLSPAVFRAARGLRTATVLTIHNYRIFCAAGIPVRNAASCTDCLDRRSVLPSLKYGCYRNSRLATLPMAFMIALHRTMGTWHQDVDAFIALTEFQKDKMSEAGLTEDRMYTKPHFFPDPPKPLPWKEREPLVVFVGRLGFEKGVHILVEAWKEWGDSAPSLELIGDGPEREELEMKVDQSGLRQKIRFCGQLPFSRVQEKLARVSLLVLPSLCFEGFPMAIREAFALGVPVAASRLGSLPCLVQEEENGVLFEPGNYSDLLRVLRQLWNMPEKLAALGRKARADFEEKYTDSVNYEALMNIYQTAIELRSRRNITRRGSI
jgi:glycosyltransferase involved in cell wall biosynthesis